MGIDAMDVGLEGVISGTVVCEDSRSGILIGIPVSSHTSIFRCTTARRLHQVLLQKILLQSPP